MRSNGPPTTRPKKKRCVTKRDTATAAPAPLKLTAEQVDLAECRAEIIRLDKWIDDLQSKMYVNCAYCGFRFGPRDTTKAAMTDVIKQHVRQCQRHPYAKALAALQQYGHHQPHCKHLRLKGPCTCGFTAALEANA